MIALLVAACGGEVPSTTFAPTPNPVVGPSATPAPATILPSAPPSATAQPSATAPIPTLAQLIGQKLVVRMEGLTPSADLLGRIRRGEVGGIIVFSFNIAGPTPLAALIAHLQAAATTGGQPPLLIAVDQEGGSISRISWAPPTLSPPQIGQIGDVSVARTQGAETGSALHALGINVDLAPVADVPASKASFMYQAGRTFSFDPTSTAGLSDAFAAGLESSGVLPAMKHFPGLGFATRNTDANVVTIEASKAALDPGLQPYRLAIAQGLPLVMLSNATYAAYDPLAAAGWSTAIGTTLLRDALGFTGVTITDSLDGTAFSRGLSSAQLALQAAAAGTDMILLTGTEKTTRTAYAMLLSQTQAGILPQAALQASYARILALKTGL